MKVLVTTCTTDGSYANLVGKVVDVSGKSITDYTLFPWYFSDDYPKTMFLATDCLVVEGL